MKIAIDDMPKRRANAVAEVNRVFNELALQNAHRDQAHDRKREIASQIANVTPPEAFAVEAEMRGISVEDLAALILSKFDARDMRELERQKLLSRIEAAKTPGPIHEALFDLSQFWRSTANERPADAVTARGQSFLLKSVVKHGVGGIYSPGTVSVSAGDKTAAFIGAQSRCRAISLS
jgi:aminopeptidase N